MPPALIGNQHAIEVLQSHLELGSFSHAYLFVGPDGVGKKNAAHFFAASLLDAPRSSLFQHPDFSSLSLEEGKKEISITAVRQVIRELSQSPFLAKRKVVVIAPAEFLSRSAADALLKTLEEPSVSCVILLLANSYERIPETLRSRMQVIRFLPVPFRTIAEYLQEEYSIPQEKAQSFANASAGLPERAVRWAESPGQWDAYTRETERFISLVGIHPSARIHAYQKEAGEEGGDIHHWIFIARDILLIQLHQSDTLIHSTFQNSLYHIARSTHPSEWVSWIRDSIQKRKLLSIHVQKKNIVEYLLLTLPYAQKP